MEDIFENKVLCNVCNSETDKIFSIKDNFRLRKWICRNCNKEWYHPGDLQEYKDFKKLKERKFQVKLRKVGNSHTISIPREIIDFEEEMQKAFGEILDLALEEPGKLSIYFSRRIKLIKPGGEEQ